MRTGVALLVVCVSLGCATRSFEPVSLEATEVIARAQTIEHGDVRVRASVPGEQETREIFGAPLYDRGIQPVWLEVTNGAAVRLRFAPAGMDRSYFSPLEVSYMHRGGFSKTDREQMDRLFHANAMPRHIPAGETRKGFVFTHVHPGTKSFIVELYGPEELEYGFTFFVEVPGFEPDHANVDFDALYDASRIENLDSNGLRARLRDIGCCTTSADGQESELPINAILIAPGTELLHVLLRSGWRETMARPKKGSPDQAFYWDGRPPDSVFRMQRRKTGDRFELRLWLAPMRVDGADVWIAQITHYVTDFLLLVNLDPNIDDARNYLLQSFWYGQGLVRHAWADTGTAVSIEDASRPFGGSSFFTDGFRLVMWLSGSPVAMVDSRYLDWDEPPLR